MVNRLLLDSFDVLLLVEKSLVFCGRVDLSHLLLSDVVFVLESLEGVKVLVSSFVVDLRFVLCLFCDFGVELLFLLSEKSLFFGLAI